MIDLNSPSPLLAEAYPLSIYWDTEEERFFFELMAFGIEAHGSASWSETIALAKLVQQMTIDVYRQQGLTLPELA